MIVKGPLAWGISRLREMKDEWMDYKSRGSKGIPAYIQWSMHDITKLIADMLGVSAYTITKLAESDLETELNETIDSYFAVSSSNLFTVSFQFTFPLPSLDLQFDDEYSEVKTC